jgi:membrane protein implicated in regulation of membrane protease activity
MVPFIWLGLAVVFGIIEAASPVLVCIWFCAGAGIAFIVSLFCDNILIQSVVFIAASIVMLIALRPFFKHRVAHDATKETDVDAMIGRTVTVTQAIVSNGEGRALLADTTWLARSEDGSAIPTGSRATIVRVDGTRLVLRPSDQQAADSSGSEKQAGAESEE